ncbi:hypothetical protein NB699_004002 [Xanthomonas sacchari]|nr:hypothetical protein [Xanthomonas sacchari]MCW0443073.1 hypothetical protein [Xanthomonas sacchari]
MNSLLRDYMSFLLMLLIEVNVSQAVYFSEKNFC